MALSSTTAAYTLIGMAEKFQDFFYADAQDVTFKYMDADGNILTTSVPNITKVTAELKASSGVGDVTSDDLVTALENYYTMNGVGELITALRSELKDYTDTAITTANTYTDDKITMVNTAIDGLTTTSATHSELNDSITTAITTANTYTDKNAAKALNFVDITYADSTYAIAENDYVRVDSADGEIVLTTPTAAANVYFEFNTGDSASVNKIRLEPGTDETITYGNDIDTDFEVSTNSRTFGVRFDSTNNTWRIN